jgi:hypothetical protein
MHRSFVNYMLVIPLLIDYQAFGVLLKSLRKNTSLTSLSIQECPVGRGIQEFATFLNYNQNLKSLSLSCINMQSQDLKKLSRTGWGKMEILHLYSTEFYNFSSIENSLDCAGAAELARSMTVRESFLKAVWLGDNDIGDIGATALSHAVRDCKSLATLSLRCKPGNTILTIRQQNRELWCESTCCCDTISPS